MHPTLFLSHGAPIEALTTTSNFAKALYTFTTNLKKPKAIVIISAHGLTTPGTIKILSNPTPTLIYDFTGFPPELYKIKYPCPGNPHLAQDIAQKLERLNADIQLNNERGLDHGVWVPLLHLFPKADIPVTQILIPYPSSPKEIFEIGKALKDLRAQDVLMIGSGGAVHNLGALGQTEAKWAGEFQEWFKDAVMKNDIDALLNFETAAPAAKLAHPEPDHLYPVFFTLGARLPDDHVETILEEFQYGTLSMYSFALTQQP